MGISGLLPALKSIQKTRYLSEFRGQTIAVDAYVWLHKGVYSCATELATGRPTLKYVDYAMHRVRLLRHFGIEPYVVFDGGPLPAKRGTELERKQRREENLSRGKALAAQGKHSQARDCFLKCIDVTPQMAYQCIKALKAENVQYVVAPYEADAQLAYLERVGLVSAVLTEDSDLLVFGCKNVLFKLDHVASTVCHVSRSDFGSVGSTTLDSSSISLLGWNDQQFCAMAILSGCDYLPSIPGIGLKTANNLLRKWRTAEGVVRAIMLEGKKTVPSGYMQQFNLAEKCFRFQRVYDPLGGGLVHLTEVEGEWDEEVDAYVGENLEPELATSIAIGDVDPVTREPMRDINPNFKPRVLRTLGKDSKSPARMGKGKGKAVGGILSFFGPNPVIPREKSAVSRVNLKSSVAGASSGKRRLGEVLDVDLANRKQHSQGALESRFFSTSPSRATTCGRLSEGPIAGPSQLRDDNKENVCAMAVQDDDDDILATLSLKANVSPTQDIDFEFGESTDGVTQEDGYMSPLSTYSLKTQEISSPSAVVFTPLKKKKRKSSSNSHGWGKPQDDTGGDSDARGGGGPQYDDFDADPISSPVAIARKRRRQSCSPGSGGITHISRPLQTPTRSLSTGNVLVAATLSLKSQNHQDGTNSHGDVFGSNSFMGVVEYKAMYNGPDLQSHLGVDDGEAGSDEVELPTSSRFKLGSNKRQSKMETIPPLNPGVSNGGLSGPRSRPSTDRKSGSGSGLDSKSDSTSPLSLSPRANQKAALTNDIGSLEPNEGGFDADTESETEMDDDIEVITVKMKEERVKKVAKGWRMKWALSQLKREDSSSSSSSAIEQEALRSKKKRSEEQKKRRQSAPMALSTNRLRRDETNVTSLGKHSLAKTGTNRPFSDLRQRQLALSLPPKSKIQPRPSGLSSSVGETSNVEPRHHLPVRKRSSLIFFNESSKTPAVTDGEREPYEGRRKTLPKFQTENDPEIMDQSSDEIVEVSPKAWSVLNKFRYQ